MQPLPFGSENSQSTREKRLVWLQFHEESGFLEADPRPTPYFSEKRSGSPRTRPPAITSPSLLPPPPLPGSLKRPAAAATHPAARLAGAVPARVPRLPTAAPHGRAPKPDLPRSRESTRIPLADAGAVQMIMPGSGGGAELVAPGRGAAWSRGEPRIPRGVPPRAPSVCR